MPQLLPTCRIRVNLTGIRCKPHQVGVQIPRRVHSQMSQKNPAAREHNGSGVTVRILGEDGKGMVVGTLQASRYHDGQSGLFRERAAGRLALPLRRLVGRHTGLSLGFVRLRFLIFLIAFLSLRHGDPPD
jgi:hypothetical protein